MCGIVGVSHYRSGRADRALVRRQTDVMRHRGPDGSDTWANERAALGHRRLALVDLSAGGRQPMSNEDGSLHLVFNGELYGWQQIRSELIERGHVLRGASDAEIVLHLYEDRGCALMSELRGEFAFALYDSVRDRLLLARDRAGVKPLYFHDNGVRLAFASELKALMLDSSVPQRVDERAVLEFLRLRYITSPRTIWSGVVNLPPGHLLVCDANGARSEQYWSLPTPTTCAIPEDDARERLRELLEEAVCVRTIADVPVGALLSGGIDSSAVAALMAAESGARVRTFSVGFEQRGLSELNHARTVAQHIGADHHELILGPNTLQHLPSVAWQLDEPFADASILPMFCLARLASSHVKTVLTGDGGDETFGGYNAYVSALRHQRLDHLPSAVRRLIGFAGAGIREDHPIARKLRRIPMGVCERHLEATAGFPSAELDRLLAPDMRRLARAEDPLLELRRTHAHWSRVIGEVPALLRLDAGTFLADDVLKKVDSASMLNSLEARVPLLDHRVLEFASSLPFAYKIRGGSTKRILRDCVRDLLPPQIVERPKTGFNVPLESWLRHDGGQFVREVLLDRRARTRGWLDGDALEDALAPRTTRRLGTQQIWSLLCLESWAQRHLDATPQTLSAT